MARELAVWLSADRVGTLAVVDGRLCFRYAPDWLSKPGAVALSISLPLRRAAFDDRETRPFFASLLPEGQLRRLLALRLQVSGQNDFALLDHIGGECANQYLDREALCADDPAAQRYPRLTGRSPMIVARIMWRSAG